MTPTRIVPLLLAASPALAAPWELDTSHSRAQFSVRHMMVSTVRGQFRTMSAKIDLDDKDLTRSTVEATIDAASIDTDEPRRDAHLKSADFFDVEKFPALTFKSKKVARAGKDRFKVTGDLTMHGVTREVVLDTQVTPEVKDPWGGVHRGILATTKVDRKDYGLTWNKALEAGGVVVGDQVDITIDAELKPPAAK